MRLTYIKFISIFVLSFAAAFAQPAKIATDYEWELMAPNRTLFRDRTMVGQIPMYRPSEGGLFGKKAKPLGRQLQIFVDVSFVPGDTVRYFGVGIEIAERKDILVSTILDAGEIPSLQQSVRYILSTSKNIVATEREDTRIRFRSKSGWELRFRQEKLDQMIYASFPEGESIDRQYSLNWEQLSIFSDLLDLTTYELKRQGAEFPPITENKP